jgi:hypothetical protein
MFQAEGGGVLSKKGRYPESTLVSRQIGAGLGDALVSQQRDR